MLIVEGSSWSSCVKASSPPAEAPTPAIENESSRVRSPTRISAAFRVVESTGREARLPSRATACLFFTRLRSTSLWANRERLEENSRSRRGLSAYKRTTHDLHNHG